MFIARNLRLLLKLIPLCLALHVPAQAAGYPERPVTLIVPWSPGGASDLIGRALASALEPVLKQSIVVENRPGAAGVIGTAVAANAPANGYTLVLVDAPHVASGSVMKKLPFDPIGSFTPVATIGKTPLAIVAWPGVPAKTLPEFRALAAGKEPLTLGSGGTGALTHLVGELLQEALGIKLTHVPFKGTGEAIQNLLGGQIHAMVSTLPGVLPHIRSGKLNAIAVTSATRAEAIREVPTVAEAGVAGFDESNWYGVLGPAGLPETVVQTLSKAITRVLADPSFRKRLSDLSIDPFEISPAAFRQLMLADQRKWADLVRKHNIAAQ